MKINDLFKQDILNPKPIIIKEYGGMLEKTTLINPEVVLLALLFSFTTIVLTLNKINYERTRKEN